MEIVDDSVDITGLTTVLDTVAMRLRGLIVHEISESPDKYAAVLNGEALAPDPALAAISGMVDNIEQGRDLTPELDRIARLIHNQDSRAEVISSLALTHDYSRYSAFLQARRRVELVLLAMANTAKLTPGDALALLAYMQEQIKSIERKVESNSTTGKDLAALLGKIDYAVSTHQQEMAKKMAKTTPQNREIMRRVAHKILKISDGSAGPRK